MDKITLGLLIGSSLSVGLATLTATAPLVNAVLNPKHMHIDNWHRAQGRWQRLRERSSLFRAGDRWIAGLGNLLERRLPWLVCPPVATDPATRILSRATEIVFGRAKPLNEAVRIRANDQPWATGEVLATAMMVATVATVFTGLITCDIFSTQRVVVIACVVWLATYRLWIWYFVSQSELRRRAIRRFLPHAMDSIAMVMTSGDPFRSGLETVIQDFPGHPLSQEFGRLRNNLERGQVMHAALSDAAQAICLPEFDEMVRVLGRVHEHGVPASENFTRLAKQLRATHLRHLEEEVGRAEAAMSLPIMLVMLACMIVAAAPFVLSMLQSDLLR